MAASSNRRRDDRVAVNGEFASVEQYIVEYVRNVSRNGAFIRSQDPLPVGTKVALRFSVIVDDLETIEGVGRVVRVVAPGGAEPPGMGVEFVELSPASRKILEAVLARQK